MTFEQSLRLAGLMPRDIVADGRWHRCATQDKPHKRNGAYILHPDGRGFWRNWAQDSEVNSWRDEQATRATPIDQAKIERQRAAERAYRVQAMRSARAYWNESRPLNRPHPYIERKGLAPLGCAGLRVNDGLLVVPVWNGEWLVSVQTITADGVKRFWPGAPVKAGAFVIERRGAALTAFCEGLATGLAVYQAAPHARVVVAFDAGNLLPVIQRMRPAGSVVIAADNDHKTKARIGVNPGLDKAHNAAELIGCGVAYPQGIEGSDWADYIKETGEGAQRRVDRLIRAGARYVSGAVP